MIDPQPTAPDSPTPAAPAARPVPEQPPVAWARRLTPFGIGRRPVRLDVVDGVVTLTRIPSIVGMRQRLVAQGPGREWHSLRLSRSGRGLHVWHGRRLFRLVGYDTDVDPFGGAGDLGPLAVILFPILLYAPFAHHRARVRADRAKCRAALEQLAPVVGEPPTGLRIRRPWPGWLLMIGRITARLAVLAAVAVGAYLWFQSR